MSINNAPEGDRLAELMILSQRVTKLIETLARESAAAGTIQPALLPRRNPRQLATELLRFRRWREACFAELSTDLFADPAWDMLLDLFVAGEEGRAISVSSLCIGSAVPATTALRWIKRIEHGGMIERIADQSDGRRVFIRLTHATRDVMIEVLSGPSQPGVLDNAMSAPPQR